MHWCFKYEFVWPLSAFLCLSFSNTLLHHFHHETLPTTVTTYERGCPWQMIGFTLLTNTLAPWNWPAWWGRRQLCPTCQAAGSLHAQQSPPALFSQMLLDQTLHFHFLLLSAWSDWLLWCWRSAWLPSSLSRMWCWEGRTGTNRP